MAKKYYPLKGFIPDVRYKTFLEKKNLKVYDITEFNVNNVDSSGLITLEAKCNCLAYSKWRGPKRSRTYPFVRVYDTYSLNTKRIAIIPIIKDEGKDGDNDRINSITFSWMSLINVYIILAWYEDAERKTDDEEKIDNKLLNAEYVREKLIEISEYQATALHWNTTHFKEDFERIFLNAVASYDRISQTVNVELHKTQDHLKTLEKYKVDNQFCLETYKRESLSASQKSALSETMTVHKSESLSDGAKGLFSISNYLGGVYYLTADGILWENKQLVIEESKNTKGKLPSNTDIKDGLFKLILYGNMEQVAFDDMKDVPFITRLRLTGKSITGTLSLPCEPELVSTFCKENDLKPAGQRTINLLNQEAGRNNLQIQITRDKRRNE